MRLSTFDWRKLFVVDAAVDLVRGQIQRAATENSIAVIAYCFMPDHLHLLVAGETDTSDCRKFMARAKQYSGYYYSQQFHARLWQRYGFDRVLREEESSESAARYTLENPVRAKLVSELRKYGYSGSLTQPLDELIAFAYHGEEEEEDEDEEG